MITYEGIGIVSMPLLRRADPQRVLGDVKNAVDRIATLPRDAEKPVVRIPAESEKALSIIVSDDQLLILTEGCGESPIAPWWGCAWSW